MDLRDVQNRFSKLTQRLDHMVPDSIVSKYENDMACNALAMVSHKLYNLLPDPSLSPLERLERLARVVKESQPDLDQLKSAFCKIDIIKNRLDQLIPESMTIGEKVDLLVMRLNELVPEKGTVIQKLESLGDPRVPTSANIDLRPNPMALAG